MDWTQNDGQSRCLILDDCLLELGNNSVVMEIYTVLAHHLNISIFTLLQTLFPPQKNMRTISINSHYLIMFQNKRDSAQYRTLSSQMVPGQTKFFLDALQKATTSKPFSYLMADLHPRSDSLYKFRSCILPHEDEEIYIPTE